MWSVYHKSCTSTLAATQPAGRDLISDMQVSRKCLLIFHSFNFGAATIHQRRNPNKGLNRTQAWMVSTETNAGLSPATLRAWLQFWWIRQASTNIDRRRLSMNLSCKCLHHINILWNVMINKHVHYEPGQNDSQHHGTGPCMASLGFDIKYSAHHMVTHCYSERKQLSNKLSSSIARACERRCFFHVHHGSPHCQPKK